jgi:hypothetical protein
MIGYCPLEEVEPQPIKKMMPPIRPPVTPHNPSPVKKTEECNYVVMGFVGGVILLALIDMVKK